MLKARQFRSLSPRAVPRGTMTAQPKEQSIEQLEKRIQRTLSQISQFPKIKKSLDNTLAMWPSIQEKKNAISGRIGAEMAKQRIKEHKRKQNTLQLNNL